MRLCWFGYLALTQNQSCFIRIRLQRLRRTVISRSWADGPSLSFVGLTSLTLSCTAKAYVPLRPAARRLPPRRLASAYVQFAADVTPRRSCSAEALQRRIEAGP